MVFYEVNEHYLSFLVLEVSGVTIDPMPGILCFDNGEENPDFAMELDGCLMQGDLKWDGCINLSFGGEMLLHFCGRDHTKVVDQVFAVLYDLGARYIEHWDADCAE